MQRPASLAPRFLADSRAIELTGAFCVTDHHKQPGPGAEYAAQPGSASRQGWKRPSPSFGAAVEISCLLEGVSGGMCSGLVSDPGPCGVAPFTWLAAGVVGKWPCRPVPVVEAIHASAGLALAGPTRPAMPPLTKQLIRAVLQALGFETEAEAFTTTSSLPRWHRLSNWSGQAIRRSTADLGPAKQFAVQIPMG